MKHRLARLANAARIIARDLAVLLAALALMAAGPYGLGALAHLGWDSIR